jgi:outer membrane receptor for ferrienterochelin and colicin
VFEPKVNVARESATAVSVSAEATWPLKLGAVRVRGAWTDILRHDYRQFEGDPLTDFLSSPTLNTDFKSRANVSVAWQRGDTTATVYVSRDGRTPNNLASIYGYGTPGAGTLATWTLCNLSLDHAFGARVRMSLAVNNLFNAMPPADHSYSGSDSVPYDTTNYNVFGRSYTVSLRYEPIGANH